MLVQLGNPRPHQGANRDPLDGPAVTYLHIPDGDHVDGSPLYGVQPYEAGAERDLALHLAQNPDITHLPGHEAFLAVTSPSGGMWQHHGAVKPSWVWSDHDHLAATLSAFYDCPTLDSSGLSAVEDSHFTRFGAPGVGAWANGPTANITQNGRDIWANLLGGGQVGAIGAGTAATGTSLTTASTFTTNQWAGSRVVVYSTTSNNMVWGNISSNTNAAGASVLTVDRWYVAATPGGSSAGTTPTTPWAFMIMDGAAPAWFMGLSASTTALGTPSTNTSLPSEIVTAGGGLIRKICPYAHTASANTFTLTPVYTANGSDSLPVTVGSMGAFNSMVVGDTTETMLFNTIISATATLTVSGDNLTLTETVTGT